MKRFAPLFILSLLLLAFHVQAQSVPVAVGGLTLTLSTDNPAPGQAITVRAESYSIDLNSSTLTWKVNGVVVEKGTGITTYETQAPALGKKTTVAVSAVASNGTAVSGSVSIGSGGVDLIMEHDGYVPAFFKGKFPLSYQNSVTVIAIPHLANSSGAEYDPKTLVYQWKKNSQVLQDQSGYGKQSATLAGDIVPRPFALSVVVSTRDSSAQASGYISIVPASPSLSFYTDDPLYGPLFNLAITDAVRIGSAKETEVLAVPFGFNKPLSSLGDLVQTWHLNGLERPELSTNKTIVLRAPENSAGSSNVSLDISNSSHILQNASAGFSAVFNTLSSNSTQ